MCAGFVACVFISACTLREPTVTLIAPDGTEKIFSVEIADTDEERAKGLMGRTELSENHGMMFVFEASQVLHFWMKNTLIPLDIFFFDKDGNFVSMASMDPCKADPCRSYSSQKEAKYALELIAGTGKKIRIGSGWHLVHGQ